jgi:starch synthase
MSKLRILYVASECEPFLSATNASEFLKKLPVDMQNNGMEIRILVPRFGNINERKNRLHEVVRLSGINIVVGEEEKSIIIKVASMPTAKIQVYFIDNDDYFGRKYVFTNKEGEFYDDNDERAIFFCKGAIETVRKLGWSPDVVHCVDWMTGLVPMYLKTSYKDDPIFKNSKVLFSVFNNEFTHVFGKETFYDKIKLADTEDEMLKSIESADFKGFIKIGMEYADKVIKGEEKMSANITELFNEFPEKTIDYIKSETSSTKFQELYAELAG